MLKLSTRSFLRPDYGTHLLQSGLAGRDMEFDAVIADHLAIVDDETMSMTGTAIAGGVSYAVTFDVPLRLFQDLFSTVPRWLGDAPWFDRLPNARDITVRMLMNHTSGLVRYELNEAFLRDLTADPSRTDQTQHLPIELRAREALPIPLPPPLTKMRRPDNLPALS